LKFVFPKSNNEFFSASIEQWQSWVWQLQNKLQCVAHFEKCFDLDQNEKAGFEKGKNNFNIQVTPYYASLAKNVYEDPIRKIFMPSVFETKDLTQTHFDPLGERKNNPAPRVIHRYPDRVLLLVTDTCSVYCRYCTRKHFTGQEQVFPKESEYDQALQYIKSKKGIREVILSGGDPLTLSDSKIEKVLSDLRSIEHIEIIRIGSRMPVVCPMRITDNLVKVIQKNKPVFLMTHFNHPRELTLEAKAGLEKLVDHGIPVFNQLVLLNGVNNHPAIIQALNRRLLYCRVKPYYMFQCDPTFGTDHLRTSIEDSEEIQKQLWGHLSGLAMSSLSLDIPAGGGKATLVPNFEISRNSKSRTYTGWDGVQSEYINPPYEYKKPPIDFELYIKEWEELKNSKND
jgi:lysine 2,3-aminomutase